MKQLPIITLEMFHCSPFSDWVHPLPYHVTRPLACYPSAYENMAAPDTDVPSMVGEKSTPAKLEDLTKEVSDQILFYILYFI